MENTRKNTLSVVLVGALIILFVVLISALFVLSLVGVLIMGWLITFFYAIFAFLMLRQTYEQKTKVEIKEVIKEIQKPVYIDKPIYVDKPIYLDKPVYIEKKRQKLNIPKYDFLASTQTKTYHTRNCRLGKLIKKKYKLSSNNKRDFIRKKFKACKVCIKKQKKHSR
jgi:hypothetical protein